MTFSSCEKALETEERFVRRFGRSGKCYHHDWNSFCLADKYAKPRKQIQSQWNVVTEDILKETTLNEEDALWMEQTTIVNDFVDWCRNGINI